MAKKPVPPRRKRRTREHIIADLSVNFVERQALLCGYSVERIMYDYGIDLLVVTYNDNGEIEDGELVLQLKATERPKILKKKKALSFRIATADLDYWLRKEMPVVFIVFDAIKEKAYWLYIQAHFQMKKDFVLDSSKEEITVHIPLANHIDPAAFRKFAQFKAQIVEQLKEIEHHE